MNSIWHTFLQEEEIWAHREAQGLCAHRGKPIWEHSDFFFKNFFCLFIF